MTEYSYSLSQTDTCSTLDNLSICWVCSSVGSATSHCWEQEDWRVTHQSSVLLVQPHLAYCCYFMRTGIASKCFSENSLLGKISPLYYITEFPKTDGAYIWSKKHQDCQTENILSSKLRIYNKETGECRISERGQVCNSVHAWLWWTL